MIDWRGMPPMAALRAFAAWAETGSVVDAADRIGVTHAAISQQIRALEQFLDLDLVSRSGRALSLTDSGRHLADALRDGFGGIARAIAELTDARSERPLYITTTPMFASSWLVPRLGAFRAAHPGHDLVIDPSPTLRKLEPGGFDIGLRHGNGDWPGLEAELLLPTELVVVGAQALVAGLPEGDLEALARLPWLAELENSEATRFLTRSGLTRARGAGLTHLPGNMMLDAARAGHGLAVVTHAFVTDDIARGDLCVMLRDSSSRGYFMLTRPGVQRAAVRAFCRWARREAAAEGGGQMRGN